MGLARSASPAMVRSPRRRQPARLEFNPTSPTAIIPTWASGGCRLADRLRAQLRASSRRLLRFTGEGNSCGPTFRDALETQKVCDAVLNSAKNGQWTKCDDMTDRVSSLKFRDATELARWRRSLVLRIGERLSDAMARSISGRLVFHQFSICGGSVEETAKGQGVIRHL